MKDLFLRAKHWMLFIPLVGATLYQYAVQGGIQEWSMKMQSPDWEPDFTNMQSFLDLALPYMIAYGLLLLLAFATTAGWMYSVAHKLHPHLPFGTNLDIGKFRIGFGFYVMTTLAFIGGLAYCIPQVIDIFSATTPPDGPPEEVMKGLLGIFGLIMIGGLIAFACQVYMCYFLGKTIKSVEEGRPSTGSETFGYLVLSYLLMIGVWIFQPKLNRWAETGSMNKVEDESVW